MTIATVGIRELKQNASQVVSRAQEGESLLVTDRGRPVARLVPLSRGSRLDELVADGLMSLPSASVFPEPLKLPAGSPSPLDALYANRDEERY
ncbi:MAG: type II toxin-antitoxin system prevent-host-death family antitoxin [Propionibacteriaceae bacterium]|jgi:prevent-host-death family protein|nr:type II toxin-antitoxin system prevent-host-death family antitoxin [Propionibacteriaceae bacterium]